MRVIRPAALLAALDEVVGTGEEPNGLCGNRAEHTPHLVTEGTLAPFWCTADQSTREPGRSQRRADSCSCAERRDYDGERIRTHCAGHCPRVRAGKWPECRGC